MHHIPVHYQYIIKFSDFLIAIRERLELFTSIETYKNENQVASITYFIQ